MRRIEYRGGRRYKKSFLDELKEWIIIIVITVTITLFVIANVFSITGIMQYSMEPNFSQGDRVVNYKLSYAFKEPRQGDIIIFNKLDNKSGIIYNFINEIEDIRENINFRKTGDIKVKYLIKKVIGVPGDIIDIKDGIVYVNGYAEEDESFQGMTFQGDKFSYPLEIPEEKVFVLGDNREYSSDSRDLGLIDYGQIKGKVTFRIWPLNKLGRIK